jgi:hypothetical protein
LVNHSRPGCLFLARILLFEGWRQKNGNASVMGSNGTGPAKGLGEGWAGETGGSGGAPGSLVDTVNTLVREIEAFKWERVAEPIWAARVEVASVYFRKRARIAAAPRPAEAQVALAA